MGSCWNCLNLKTQTVTRKRLSKISKRCFQKAIKDHDYQRLDLGFPLTCRLFNRAKAAEGPGQLQIFYCREGLFARHAYEVKDNSRSSSTTNRGEECPSYKQYLRDGEVAKTRNQHLSFTPAPRFKRSKQNFRIPYYSGYRDDVVNMSKRQPESFYARLRVKVNGYAFKRKPGCTKNRRRKA